MFEVKYQSGVQEIVTFKQIALIVVFLFLISALTFLIIAVLYHRLICAKIIPILSYFILQSTGIITIQTLKLLTVLFRSTPFD